MAGNVDDPAWIDHADPLNHLGRAGTCRIQQKSIPRPLEPALATVDAGQVRATKLNVSEAVLRRVRGRPVNQGGLAFDA